MITINGKVFRNLEEQVAYLSEIIPLFSFENGRLVITQGDGTEIVRLEVNDIKDIRVNTVNDIATLTMTYNDGTTTTQTINMTSYLKKNTTTTTKNQVYTKMADGTQGFTTLDDQASNSTIVMRTSSGRINSVDPVYDGNVATKKYVDDAVSGGGGSPRYKHFVNVQMEDGCSESLRYFLTFESSSDTQLTIDEFKALFDLAVIGNTEYKMISKICSQYLLKEGYSEPALVPCAMVYDTLNDRFKDYLAYNTTNLYSSDLTLVLLVDSVSSL